MLLILVLRHALTSFLSSRSVGSTEQVPGQPSLGSEGNLGKQKSGEDVIEQRATFQSQQAEKLASFGNMALGLRVKNRKGYGITLCYLRKIREARCVGWGVPAWRTIEATA